MCFLNIINKSKVIVENEEVVEFAIEENEMKKNTHAVFSKLIQHKDITQSPSIESIMTKSFHTIKNSNWSK